MRSVRHHHVHLHHGLRAGALARIWVTG